MAVFTSVMADSLIVDLTNVHFLRLSQIDRKLSRRPTELQAAVDDVLLFLAISCGEKCRPASDSMPPGRDVADKIASRRSLRQDDVYIGSSAPIHVAGSWLVLPANRLAASGRTAHRRRDRSPAGVARRPTLTTRLARARRRRPAAAASFDVFTVSLGSSRCPQILISATNPHDH